MHVITLQIDGPFYVELNVRTDSALTTDTETDTDMETASPGQQEEQGDTAQTGADQPETGEMGSLNVAQDPIYGEHLTDVEGRTLYIYTGEDDGFFVGEGWEAVTATDDDLPGSGVDAALMGEIERDGVRFRTYADRPLYRYSGDTEPGTITGQGMDGIWWVVSPTGEAIEEE